MSERINKEVKAAQQAAKDAQYSAHVALAFYNFFKAHYREGLSSCEANRGALEEYLDANLLDCADAVNIEIAYLAVGSQLVRTKSPVAPTPPAPPVPPPIPLSEQDRLRQILRENRGNPKAQANAARAVLKTKDVHATANARRVLPAEYDRKRLLTISGTEMRDLQKRFGFDAINSRLNER